MPSGSPCSVRTRTSPTRASRSPRAAWRTSRPAASPCSACAASGSSPATATSLSTTTTRRRASCGPRARRRGDGATGPAGLAMEELPIRDAEPLRAELVALVQAVREGRGPGTGRRGRAPRRSDLAERILAALPGASGPPRDLGRRRNPLHRSGLHARARLDRPLAATKVASFPCTRAVHLSWTRFRAGTTPRLRPPTDSRWTFRGAALASITVDALLENGVHFGHRASRWNPKMKPYIHGKRNTIHIIDLKATVRGPRACEPLPQARHRRGRGRALGRHEALGAGGRPCRRGPHEHART